VFLQTSTLSALNPRGSVRSTPLRATMETNLKARSDQLRTLDAQVAAPMLKILVALYSYVTEPQLVSLCPLLWRHCLDDSKIELFGPARSAHAFLKSYMIPI
jgi:hypothetical protein